MQLISAITSLAYIAVGIAKIDYPAVGISLILLGVASGLFHATGLGWAQAADEIAMYLAFTALIGWEISGDHVFTAVFAFTLTLFAGFFHDRFDSHAMVPFLFLVLVLIRVWKLQPLMFVLAFAVAGVFWFTGREIPEGRDLWHGMWHLMTAWGFLLI